MSDDRTYLLGAGDVVRTPAGTIHGVKNTRSEQFFDIAATTPLQDFTADYQNRQLSG
jgi:quercetin dioxygenase-like cupin family protein